MTASTTDRKTLMGRPLTPSPYVVEMIGDPATRAPETRDRQIRAVLFSDIVGSTAYFEQRGDEAGLAMVELHNRLLFPQVEGHHGAIIKTIGDAIMAAYESVGEAVLSAVAMQEALKKHNAAQADTERIHIRIGVNFGSVICQGQDLFGDVVNAAARIEALASGDKILVSGSVRTGLGHEPTDSRAGALACTPFDAVRVKGKKEPIEVFEIVWDPTAALPSGPRPLLAAGDITGGRYEILALLGEGGMGQVFRAQDAALDEEVALKFIRRDLATDGDSLARFKQEVRLARSVTHRNICRIHEFLQMDEHTFISMELIRGRSLDDLIGQEAPCGPEQTLAIAADICAGLAEAHKAGIIHRDLKPANIMLEEGSGRAVITDFGIARLTAGRRMTQDNMVVGTPEYMSPEQAQGEEVGPPADLYSVGAILYEMLTGTPPLTADTPMAVALKQITEQPDSLLSRNAQIPPRLNSVVLRCLAKKPGRRYQSATDLAHALNPDAPSAAQNKTSGRRLLGLAIGLAVLIAGLLFLWPSGTAPTKALAPASVRTLVSSQAVEQAGRWSPNGRFFAFIKQGDAWVSPYPDAHPIRSTTDIGATASAQTAGITWSHDGDKLIFPVAKKDVLQLVEVPAFGGPVTPLGIKAMAVDVSADGKRLALCEKDEQGYIHLAVSGFDGSDKKRVATGDSSIAYRQPRWSPDGTKLSVVLHYTGYGSSRDIGLVQVDSGRVQALTKDGKQKLVYNTDPTWTADGKWIVYASKRTGTLSLWRVSVKGGPSQPITQGATANQRGPDVSADGRTILFSTFDIRLDIASRSLGNGRDTAISDDLWSDRFPVWSPNGQQLAFRSQRSSADAKKRSIVLLSADRSHEQVLGAPVGMRDFVWCGSKALAYAATAGGQRQLGLLGLENAESRLLVNGFHRLWSPSADAACKNLIFAGRKTKQDPSRIWAIDTATGPARQVHAEPGHESFPCWSPDGSQIAYRWAPAADRLGETELRLTDRQGKGMRTVTKHPSFQRSRRRIRFSANGRWLYYMEAISTGGRLWKVRTRGGAPQPVTRLDTIHTFDFDLSADGQHLLYPRATHSGDLFCLENVDW